MKRRALLAGTAALACTAALPQRTAPTRSAEPADRVGSLLRGMSIADRAGQTMSVAFHGTRITAHLERMIREKHIGGVVLFRENAGEASAFRRLADDLQRLAREAGIPPLFIATDHEGGPVLRVTQGLALPPAQMALAASPDPAGAVRRSAALGARELRSIGANWVLAPVADVNDEPRNPIIGNRSFGSEPARVGELVAVAVRAYGEASLLCCVKHFPGHGSVTVDSHLGLPQSGATRARLDAVELAPFRAAIAAGAPAIMTAHIRVPSLGTADAPATLSRAVLTDLLRAQLGFRGLVVTDDLEMGALSSVGGQARSGLGSLQAGADYLLFRFDEGAQLEGHRLIVEAASAGALPAPRLEDAARRVLEAKARWGVLDPATPAAFDLGADRAEAQDLARGAITLLRAGGLPLRGRVLAVSFGTPDIAVAPEQPTLADVVGRALPAATVRNLPGLDDATIRSVTQAALASDVAVVGTFDVAGDPRQRRLVESLQSVRPTVAVALRAPYDISEIPSVAGYLCAYSGREPALVAAVEVMTGTRPPQGRLPVEVPGLYPVGAGLRSL